MDEVINNPSDFISNRKLAPENLHIVDIEEELVDSQEFYNITQSFVSDNHCETFLLRFRYAYADRSNGLLKVQPDGQVCVNGEVCDKNTWFKVIHSFEDSSYRIICIEGENQNKVLYMDRNYLKTREYIHGHDDYSKETQFDFVRKANNSWEISARTTGHILKFDKETGMYLPQPTNDQVDCPALFCDPDIGPKFKVYIPKWIKVTTV
ncbi:uncharacterized protein LOC117320826 [Pecten maximus]|uniref:uncharacterized protein LOC117320826 n=1 Tax=Pecten maximus TaxID=6579 RepID=UPI001458A467|nr:uncharacterized protein LOC117320826 [Pecten maximus]XP_033731211.1 uncharacterized protein LOC117320826 [Pecten maximus]